MYEFINTGNWVKNLNVENPFTEASYFPSRDLREKRIMLKYANADSRMKETLDEALQYGVLEKQAENDLEQFSKYKDLLPSDIHSRPYRDFIGKFSPEAAKLASKIVFDKIMKDKKQSLKQS